MTAQEPAPQAGGVAEAGGGQVGDDDGDAERQSRPAGPGQASGVAAWKARSGRRDHRDRAGRAVQDGVRH